MGPGLRLTKLFMVFKTGRGGVRGTGAQQESPIFLSLGLGLCPCLCLWELGVSCRGLELGMPPLGERLTQFYLRSLDEAEDGHPFSQQTFLERHLRACHVLDDAV